MTFPYAVTVRSMPGKSADYGRALERVAFFPGVTAANVIHEAADSITIGYRGRRSLVTRDFCFDLSADDLVADGPFWEAGRALPERRESYPIALYSPMTWRGHFQTGDGRRRRSQAERERAGSGNSNS